MSRSKEKRPSDQKETICFFLETRNTLQVGVDVMVNDENFKSKVYMSKKKTGHNAPIYHKRESKVIT